MWHTATQVEWHTLLQVALDDTGFHAVIRHFRLASQLILPSAAAAAADATIKLLPLETRAAEDARAVLRSITHRPKGSPTKNHHRSKGQSCPSITTDLRTVLPQYHT